MKSSKLLYVIYADLESLIEKIDGCVNNLQRQKLESMFLMDIQFEESGDLTIYKTNILCIVEQIA